MPKKSFYAVKAGRTPGIYTTWASCEEQVKGFSGAAFKGFSTRAEAVAWFAPSRKRPREEDTLAPDKKSKSLGKAGSRTQTQTRDAKRSAQALIDSFAATSIICYTDGACIGNPGPAGCGAVVILPGGKAIEGYRALGQGTNNIAELTAVDLALDLIPADLISITCIEILTDSKYTQGILSKSWKATKNKELISKIKDKLAHLSTMRVRIHWVGGHVGIDGNERADRLANLGAKESSSTL